MEANPKELLEYLAGSLVDSKDEVRVEAVEDGETLNLALHVSKSELGKVIGKQGRIARALRILVRASAVRAGKRATVDIVD